MRNKTLAICMLALSSFAYADINVSHKDLGTGVPGKSGADTAVFIYDGMYHVPQYMPGYPTAAPIWQRVVEVDCTVAGKDLECVGYNWLPEFGRAEYLMIKPKMVQSPAPKIVEKVIFKEVPAKKKGE